MGLLVEMGWGGLVQAPDTITWTDISQYVDLVSGVSITRGASDELAEIQPGTATLVLDNVDGRFTPGNTASPYWPHVRRNAPIRISVVVDGVTFPRFYGMVNEFPAEWHGLLSKVQITCTDLFKRLNRLPELRSVLTEEMLIEDEGTPTSRKLAAYYPLAEASDATSAGDLSSTGCLPLEIRQAFDGGSVSFGSDGPPALGAGAASFDPATDRAGQYLLADLGPEFEADDVDSWQIYECWFKTSTPGRAIMGLHSPNLDYQWVFALDESGELVIEHTNIGGGRGSAFTGSGVLTDDQWHHVLYDAASATLWVDGAQSGTPWTGIITVMYGLRTLHVGAFRGTRLFAGEIAHAAVWHTAASYSATMAPLHWEAGTNAFGGETADQRIMRLARYAGLDEVTIYGTTHDPVAGQGEPGSTVAARMREVELTEGARLVAERTTFGLAYQSRDLRYNPILIDDAFTLDYADLETPDFRLADDDQKLCNIASVSRPGGANQRVTDPASIAQYGQYETQLDVLKMNDAGALSVAQWLVSRYADPPPELREVPIEAYTLPSYTDILAADISSCITIQQLPAQAPAAEMRVTVEGYTETIQQGSHLIRYVTSATLTDSVWILDDPTYSVLDTSTRLAY